MAKIGNKSSGVKTQFKMFEGKKITLAMFYMDGREMMGAEYVENGAPVVDKNGNIIFWKSIKFAVQ
jgi:hypothetical protein